MANREYTGYDIILGGIFGALALVISSLFHLVNAGKIFLPMFLPIVALACLANWRVVLSIATLVPILGYLILQMPSLFPPILPIMIVELIVISLIIILLYQKLKINVYVTLIISAVVDRILLFIILYLLEKQFLVISGMFSVFVVIQGIPGFILQLIIVPPLIKYLEQRIAEFKKIV